MGGATNGNNVPTSGVMGLLERPFLLLFLGVAIPFISYTLWGLVEIAMLKPLPLN